MWIEWVAILQVLVFGLLGAWASFVLMRHDDEQQGNVRRFPSRWQRWYGRRARREELKHQARFNSSSGKHDTWVRK